MQRIVKLRCYCWLFRGLASRHDVLTHVAVLKKTFAMFDSGKTGMIDTDKIKTILNTLGQNFDDDELAALIEENDTDGKSGCISATRERRTK